MEWRDLHGFEDYYLISEYGDIKNKKTGKVRKIKPNVRHGYLDVDLYNDTKVYYKRVHRLVAETFLPLPDDYENKVVMHLDNNKTNNHYTNLKWGTISENTAQAYADGLATAPTSIQCNLVSPGGNIKTFDTKKSLGAYVGLGDYAVNTCIKEGTPIKRGKYKGYKITLN